MVHLTLEQFTIFLFCLAGAFAILTAGGLVYAVWLILKLKKYWTAARFFEANKRDANGRKIRERL